MTAEIEDVHGEDVPDGAGAPALVSRDPVPLWVLDETALANLPPAPPRLRRPFRRVAVRALTVAALVPALGLSTATLTDPGSSPWAPTVRDVSPAAQPSAATPSPDARPTDRPAPGVGAASEPRGVPLPPPPGGGTHAFVTFQDDGVTPVAYDPCRPVHYVIRPDGAPPGGEQIVREAVARIGEITGLQFVHRGATDESPADQRAPYQPERYGRRWAPVLVSWDTEEQNPALAGDVVGEAGSVPASIGDSPRVFLTGSVSLDSPRLTELLRGRNGRTVVRSIVLHELGHLMGLAHVDDEQQLMFPEARREVPDFAAGDLTGLAVLGAGPCVPQL